MSDETASMGAAEPTVGEVLDEGRLPAGEWLPPATAASRLGVSERTLWRLVKGGRYHKRTERGRAEVLVPLPDDRASDGVRPPGSETVVSTASGTPVMAGRPPDTFALAILEELRRQREDDAERLTRQAETIGRLTAEFDAARAELEGLRASRIEATTSTPPPGVPVRATGGWWRRWASWLASAD